MVKNQRNACCHMGYPPIMKSFAFSSRVFPKASQIKISEKSRNYQRRIPMGSPASHGYRHPCRGGSLPMESVAALLWNQWQLSCGTDGSFAVESVAGFTWNQWQLCRGIRNGVLW